MGVWWDSRTSDRMWELWRTGGGIRRRVRVADWRVWEEGAAAAGAAGCPGRSVASLAFFYICKQKYLSYKLPVPGTSPKKILCTGEPYYVGTFHIAVDFQYVTARWNVSYAIQLLRIWIRIILATINLKEVVFPFIKKSQHFAPKPVFRIRFILILRIFKKDLICDFSPHNYKII